MSWVTLAHDDNNCLLPRSDDIVKNHARPGDIWKCGATGCNRVFRYDEDGEFTELQKIEMYKPNPESVAAKQAEKEETERVYQARKQLRKPYYG